MDIMNEMPEKKFNELDDLLAFISIYDDENRTHAFFKMLDKNKKYIKNHVCVEAGCGFGLLSEKMAKLGAWKVYAVEANPYLFDIAQKRLAAYPNVKVVLADIRDFRPPEPVDVLVHEFFGQILYDEDIYVLDQLKFKPAMVLPEHAVLSGGCMDSAEMIDDTVTPDILQKLDGALVSGLFEDDDLELSFPVIDWIYGNSSYKKICDISAQKGDLLYMGLQIFNQSQFVCQAGVCDNWSYIWTPRAGDRFVLEFEPDTRGTLVHFYWL